MICPKPGCCGTVEVRIARGHDEAHCVRCFRCVGLAEVMSLVESLRAALAERDAQLQASKLAHRGGPDAAKGEM